MALKRSMIMIFMVCFVSVWFVDTPVANAGYKQCVDKGEQKCFAKYDKCPEKDQDAMIKSAAWQNWSFEKRMKKLGKISEVCFKKWAVCVRAVEAVCGKKWLRD